MVRATPPGRGNVRDWLGAIPSRTFLGASWEGWDPTRGWGAQRGLLIGWAPATAAYHILGGKGPPALGAAGITELGAAGAQGLRSGLALGCHSAPHFITASHLKDEHPGHPKGGCPACAAQHRGLGPAGSRVAMPWLCGEQLPCSMGRVPALAVKSVTSQACRHTVSFSPCAQVN